MPDDENSFFSAYFTFYHILAREVHPFGPKHTISLSPPPSKFMGEKAMCFTYPKNDNDDAADNRRRAHKSMSNE
jgi:hypothetical protein